MNEDLKFIIDSTEEAMIAALQRLTPLSIVQQLLSSFDAAHLSLWLVYAHQESRVPLQHITRFLDHVLCNLLSSQLPFLLKL